MGIFYHILYTPCRILFIFYLIKKMDGTATLPQVIFIICCYYTGVFGLIYYLEKNHYFTNLQEQKL